MEMYLSSVWQTLMSFVVIGKNTHFPLIPLFTCKILELLTFC